MYLKRILSTIDKILDFVIASLLLYYNEERVQMVQLHSFLSNGNCQV